MKIVTIPSLSLRQPSLEVKDFTTIKALVKEMEETIHRAGGVGLAAPQIGCNLQLFIIRPGLAGDINLPSVYVNPKMKYIGNKIGGLEGCLSIPGKRFLVQRFEKVIVTAQDIAGGTFKVVCEGWPARVLQHEFSHLNGFLIDAEGVELVLPVEGESE